MESHHSAALDVFHPQKVVELDEKASLKLGTLINDDVQRRSKIGDPVIEYGSCYGVDVNTRTGTACGQRAYQSIMVIQLP